MKNRLALVSAAALVLTALVAPASVPLVAGASSDVDQARQAGQSFIQNSITAFPDWKGAALGQAQLYHDLEGGVNAFMFPIQKAGATIGRIVIGSAAFQFDVFEAGSAPPPALPLPAGVAASMQNDLGIKADVAAIGVPRLTYLGYDRYLASYEVAGNTVAVDVRDGRAYRAAELRDARTPAGEYQSLRDSRVTRLSVTRELGVPVRNMNDNLIPPGMRTGHNCGPTAGAEISEYYKYNWAYDRLSDWPSDHNRLYVTMGTDSIPYPNGTLPQNWGPGFVTYAGEYPRSYTFGTFWVQSPFASDFTAIKNYIDTSRPLAVMFWGYPFKSPPYPPKYTWHYVAVRGYQIDDYGSQYMIVNDGWGGIDTVNWDINYGSLSLHFVYPS